MDAQKIKDALIAARSLLYIDQVSPAVHEFEKDKRTEAREKITTMINEALAELPET